jgi:regulator of sigma E protease
MFITVISSIFVFGILIFFHELGHFLVAKRAGVAVQEFALGFGPKVISWTSGETDYSLRIFPLGGFVRLTGEDPDETDEPGSFQKQRVATRFAVIAAGPFMNFLLAVVLFSLLYFAFTGIAAFPVQIGEVLDGGRADQVGLEEGDILLTIDGKAVESWDQVVRVINENPDQEILMVVERDGEVLNFPVTPRADEETGRGLIGIGPQTHRYQLIPSLRLGLANTWRFTNFIIVSLIGMIRGQIPADIAGPVGIISIVGEVAQTGLVNLLSLAAVLSINLGLINLLPIPALDGSRLVFLLVEGIRGRPVDPKKESFVHFVGFTLLILLMIFIAYRDVIRLDLF